MPGKRVDGNLILLVYYYYYNYNYGKSIINFVWY